MVARKQLKMNSMDTMKFHVHGIDLSIEAKTSEIVDKKLRNKRNISDE